MVTSPGTTDAHWSSDPDLVLRRQIFAATERCQNLPHRPKEPTDREMMTMCADIMNLAVLIKG